MDGVQLAALDTLQHSLAGDAQALGGLLHGDVALIKAHRSDRLGNLVFRKSAQNFNPIMAMACNYVVAEVEHIEEVGAIDPDHVMLPGIFVDTIVHKQEGHHNEAA